MSGLLFVVAAGSVIGPIILGFGMSTALGAPGLMLISALLLMGLALFMILRLARILPLLILVRDTSAFAFSARPVSNMDEMIRLRHRYAKTVALPDGQILEIYLHRSSQRYCKWLERY